MSWPLAGDQLSREAARRAAERELSDSRYSDAQPPLVLRLIGRGLHELLSLLDRAASNAPGGRLGLLLLAVLVLGFAAVVLTRLAPGRRVASPAVFAAGRPLSAADHRVRAELAADRGDWSDAVRERLRAAVRELEVRGVLDPRPGRTADEVARDAAAMVPSLAPALHAGTRVFDEVWYGGRQADAASYATVVALDDAVTRSRLAVT